MKHISTSSGGQVHRAELQWHSWLKAAGRKAKATAARVCTRVKHACNSTRNQGANDAGVNASNPVPPASPAAQGCPTKIHNDRPSNQLIFSSKWKLNWNRLKIELEQAPNELSAWKFIPDMQTHHTPQPRLSRQSHYEKAVVDSQVFISTPMLRFSEPKKKKSHILILVHL